jgi:hypothetical protein
MQRSFVRNVRRMITDTIINNRDIYDEAIKKDNSRDANASATAPTSPTKNNTNNNNLDPHPSMPTPSPNKKARITTSTNDGITSHQPIVNAGSDGKDKYDLVGKALGKDSSLVGDADLDRLIMQAVALKQSRIRDNTVLNYKDFNNGKEKYFVKVSTNTTDEGFTMCSGWLDKCFEINGMKDSEFKSAKRCAKKIRRQYGEAFHQALEEEGIMTPVLLCEQTESDGG